MEKRGAGMDLEAELGEYKSLLTSEPTAKARSHRLRSFPLALHKKRVLLEACDASASVTCSESCAESCQTCKTDCAECCSNMELWSRQIKIIEGMFGAGVGAFFSLLRSLLILNALLFLAFLVFLILPQGLNSSDAAETKMLQSLWNQSSLAYTCSLTYKTKIANITAAQSIATKVLDFLSGTGWMEKTLLFFGAYFPVETTVTTISYNYPLAYLTVLGFSFLASIILLLIFAGRAFKASVISEKSVEVSRYCNSVFAGWDYSLMSEKNADLKSNMVYNEVIGNLQDDDYLETLKNMSQGRKCCLYVVRAIINILILGMLGGAGYLIYYVQLVSSESTTSSTTNLDSIVRLIMEYLPSLTIAAIGAIFPVLFKLLILLEKYSSETVVILTLIRIVFVKLFSIVVLVISLYSIITCSSKDSCNVGITPTCKQIYCWESYVGQQFYKLAITQFLVFLVVTFGVEGLRAVIVKKCHCKLSEIIGLPEFDISKCVLDLIYLQIITWFATLFCPMLMGITTLILFILFYLKLFACHLCYKPSEVPFKASRSNFFFLVVLMFAFFLCILPIGYCIVKIPTSKGCGPFRSFTYMYDVIPATISGWPSWAVTLFQWIGSAAFVGLLFIIMLIIIYYYATLASTRLSVNHRLQHQVNAESRSKQALFRQLVEAGMSPAIKNRSVGHKASSSSKAQANKSPAKVAPKSGNEGPPDSYAHDGWE